MRNTMEIIQGGVKKDPYGSWDDSDRGIYIDGDNIDYIFSEFIGKNIKVTIEVIE